MSEPAGGAAAAPSYVIVEWSVRGRTGQVVVPVVGDEDPIPKAKLQAPFGCRRFKVLSAPARARDDLA